MTNPKFKILYYRQKCIGCGYCSDLLPNYWSIDIADGKANLENSQLEGLKHSLVIYEELAIFQIISKDCPAKIISISNF
jgi:ferredoxin